MTLTVTPMVTLPERQRRVQLIADALYEPDYDVLMRYATILGDALGEGFNAQQFFSRFSPVLRGYGIKTPPSLNTWRAVRKEILRRAAEFLESDPEDD